MADSSRKLPPAAEVRARQEAEAIEAHQKDMAKATEEREARTAAAEQRFIETLQSAQALWANGALDAQADRSVRGCLLVEVTGSGYHSRFKKAMAEHLVVDGGGYRIEDVWPSRTDGRATIPPTGIGTFEAEEKSRIQVWVPKNLLSISEPGGGSVHYLAITWR